MRRCTSVGAAALRARLPRAYALNLITSHEALDLHNAHALRALRRCRRDGGGIDTVQLWQQPLGGNSVRWTTELWDVRHLDVRPGSAASAARLHEQQRALFGWTDGRPCEPHALASIYARPARALGSRSTASMPSVSRRVGSRILWCIGRARIRWTSPSSVAATALSALSAR